MIRKIAKIESTTLGFEHGDLTCMLHVNYGGSGQGIGGYCLGEELGSPAGSFIARVLKACGVDKWEALKGRTIYVLLLDGMWNSQVVGIENLPTEPGEQFLFSDWQEAAKTLLGGRHAT